MIGFDNSQAWLLDREGNYFDVIGHPSERFEFDSIVDIIEKYGSEYEQTIAEEYRNNPTEELKSQLLDIYNNNWCKVRSWGLSEVTFRITSNSYNWYPIINQFLLDNPRFQNMDITVENSRGRVYWKSISWNDATDPKNEQILASVFLD